MADNFISREIRNAFSPTGKMVSRLIIINVIVFLALRLISLVIDLTQSGFSVDTIIRLLSLPSDTGQLLHRPWTFITYEFIHFDLWHIVFNMLWLYWIGIILADFLGNKKVLPVYLMGSWFGGALYILAYNVFPYFEHSVANSYCLGASAGVMAIVVAAATLTPDYSIILFIWPIRLKWLAAGMVVIDLISVNAGNPGGHIAHLGGALFGFIFIKQLQSGNDWSKWLNNFFDFVVDLFSGKKSRLKVSYSKEKKSEMNKRTKRDEEIQQEKIDVILDKISKSGYDSLTKEEKEFLFNTSRDSK